MTDQISIIDIEKIVANPNNPRTRIEDVSDLVASINEQGLMQPIIVRWTKKRDKNGMPTGYEVIAGSRRLTACRKLGIKKVNCIVMDVNDAKAFELATTENIVRENMTPADEARAVAKLFSEGKGRMEVGAIFGKTGRWAEGRRRIANLGEKVLSMLDEGKINLGHAEALALCDESRVEKWLSDAKWKNPEELRKDIMRYDRQLLDDAPFDWKKCCANCPKRSDCQKDLFGDQDNVYCLDSDCYTDQINKECERLEKQFKKAGYEAVPEEDFSDAQDAVNTYSFYKGDTYIFPGNEHFDEDDKKDAEKIVAGLRKKGEKAKYFIDKENAVGYLVWKNADAKEDDEDEDESENTSVAESTGSLAGITSYQDREKIKNFANEEEERIVSECVKAEFDKQNNGNFELICKMIAHAMDFRVRYEEADDDGETTDIEESPITSTSESVSEEYEDETFDNSVDAVISKVVNSIVEYNGVADDDLRKFFKIPERSVLMQKARERFDDESKKY